MRGFGDLPEVLDDASSLRPSGADNTSMPCVRDRRIKRSGGGGAVVAPPHGCSVACSDGWSR